MQCHTSSFLNSQKPGFWLLLLLPRSTCFRWISVGVGGRVSPPGPSSPPSPPGSYSGLSLHRGSSYRPGLAWFGSVWCISESTVKNKIIVQKHPGTVFTAIVCCICRINLPCTTYVTVVHKKLNGYCNLFLNVHIIEKMQVCVYYHNKPKRKRECHSKNNDSLQKASWIYLSEKVKISKLSLHTASVRQKNQHYTNRIRNKAQDY